MLNRLHIIRSNFELLAGLALRSPKEAGKPSFFHLQAPPTADARHSKYLRSTIAQETPPRRLLCQLQCSFRPCIAPPSVSATLVEDDVVNLYRKEVPFLLCTAAGRASTGLITPGAAGTISTSAAIPGLSASACGVAGHFA